MEVMLVSALMTMLVMLLAGAWSGLGRPSVDAAVRCRVSQQASLAIQSLARDFGGSLPEQAIGPTKLGCLVGSQAVGGSQLLLCFDGGLANGSAEWAAPDTVIAYEVQGNRLIRSNQQAGTQATVARDVERMELTQLADGVQIVLTVSYRGTSQAFTLITEHP